jgi:hypothetical protein
VELVWRVWMALVLVSIAVGAVLIAQSRPRCGPHGVLLKKETNPDPLPPMGPWDQAYGTPAGQVQYCPLCRAQNKQAG